MNLKATKLDEQSKYLYDKPFFLKPVPQAKQQRPETRETLDFERHDRRFQQGITTFIFFFHFATTETLTDHYNYFVSP